MRNLLVGLVTASVMGALVVLNPALVPPEVRDLLGVGPSRLGSAPEVSGNGTYRFLQHQRGNAGAPVTYNPCEAVRIEINPSGVDDEDGATDIVLKAMKAVSSATGLRLEYTGPSTDRPRWRSSSEPAFGRSRPSLVSFATSEEVSELEGRVAGIGGSTLVRRNGVSTYVSGQVTLDVNTIDGLLDEPGGVDLARAIAMHELAHLVGLAHVKDQGELMNAQNQGRLAFGPGDRRGLGELGRGRCT